MNSYKRGQAFVYRSLHTYLINLLSGLETICFISAKRHYRQASRELCSVQKGTYTYITKHGLLYLSYDDSQSNATMKETQKKAIEMNLPYQRRNLGSTASSV